MLSFKVFFLSISAVIVHQSCPLRVELTVGSLEGKQAKLICIPSKQTKIRKNILWEGFRLGVRELHNLTMRNIPIPNIKVNSTHLKCYLKNPKSDSVSNKSRVERELAGTVQTENGNCPPGYRIDQDRCYPCFPGSYTSGQETECFLCPRNFYISKEGADACWPCPAGTGTKSEGANSVDACVDLGYSGSGFSSYIIHILLIVFLILSWIIIAFLLIRYYCSGYFRGHFGKQKIVDEDDNFMMKYTSPNNEVLAQPVTDEQFLSQDEHVFNRYHLDRSPNKRKLLKFDVDIKGSAIFHEKGYTETIRAEAEDMGFNHSRKDTIALINGFKSSEVKSSVSTGLQSSDSKINSSKLQQNEEERYDYQISSEVKHNVSYESQSSKTKITSPNQNKQKSSNPQKDIMAIINHITSNEIANNQLPEAKLSDNKVTSRELEKNEVVDIQPAKTYDNLYNISDSHNNENNTISADLKNNVHTGNYIKESVSNIGNLFYPENSVKLQDYSYSQEHSSYKKDSNPMYEANIDLRAFKVTDDLKFVRNSDSLALINNLKQVTKPLVIKNGSKILDVYTNINHINNSKHTGRHLGKSDNNVNDIYNNFNQATGIKSTENTFGKAEENKNIYNNEQSNQAINSKFDENDSGNVEKNKMISKYGSINKIDNMKSNEKKIEKLEDNNKMDNCGPFNNLQNANHYENASEITSESKMVDDHFDQNQENGLKYNRGAVGKAEKKNKGNNFENINQVTAFKHNEKAFRKASENAIIKNYSKDYDNSTASEKSEKTSSNTTGRSETQEDFLSSVTEKSSTEEETLSGAITIFNRGFSARASLNGKKDSIFDRERKMIQNESGKLKQKSTHRDRNQNHIQQNAQIFYEGKRHQSPKSSCKNPTFCLRRSKEDHVHSEESLNNRFKRSSTDSSSSDTNNISQKPLNKSQKSIPSVPDEKPISLTVEPELNIEDKPLEKVTQSGIMQFISSKLGLSVTERTLCPVHKDSDSPVPPCHVELDLVLLPG